VNASATMVYVSVSVLAIGEGLVSPAILELISRGADDRSQGKVQGGNQGMQSLANIAGPLIVGTIYDSVGHAAPYVIGAVGMLVVIALLGVALPALNRYTETKTATSAEATA
jgi:DHA1 family tetracycline resistance protein-like MFS transporter